MGSRNDHLYSATETPFWIRTQSARLYADVEAMHRPGEAGQKIISPLHGHTITTNRSLDCIAA